MERIITEELQTAFRAYLKADEKQKNTIEKYLRDLRTFCVFADKKEITKELVMDYKRYLLLNYRVSSANSMLVALNRFFRWIGWTDCTVKTFKVQSVNFRPASKSLTVQEYQRLAEVAQKKGQTWLYLLMVTLCSTGIRIGELLYITVQSLSARQITVKNKGKVRRVILPKELCQKLQQYAKEKQITKGSIFVTRSGKPIDRSNIHRAMKKLCQNAEVEPSKVFPHNLRHLFAIQYYSKHHDLSGLAAILGHSNINTTRIYTMVTLNQKEEEINSLGLVV